jgi:hypothetical protein
VSLLAAGAIAGAVLLGMNYYFYAKDRQLRSQPADFADWLASLANDPSPPVSPFVPADDNFTLIEPGLYMGGWISKPPPDVKAVLNLCELEDPYKADNHRWMMIPDAEPAPPLDWIRKAVDYVTERRKEGTVTYVHCAVGRSRAGLVTTAYLMADRGWSRDRALEYIRAKRPEVSPNPAFMDRLLEWERLVVANK